MTDRRGFFAAAAGVAAVALGRKAAAAPAAVTPAISVEEQTAVSVKLSDEDCKKLRSKFDLPYGGPRGRVTTLPEGWSVHYCPGSLNLVAMPPEAHRRIHDEMMNLRLYSINNAGSHDIRPWAFLPTTVS